MKNVQLMLLGSSSGIKFYLGACPGKMLFGGSSRIKCYLGACLG